ncbi:MAG: hypothetical protein J0J03_13800 [Leifsonia sp.]|nr:hypothetical protein [Leifsonia sp.]
MTIASVIVPDHLELLDDAALLSLQSSIAASRRELDALSARVSAEVGAAQIGAASSPRNLLQRCCNARPRSVAPCQRPG